MHVVHLRSAHANATRVRIDNLNLAIGGCSFACRSMLQHGDQVPSSSGRVEETRFPCWPFRSFVFVCLRLVVDTRGSALLGVI